MYYSNLYILLYHYINNWTLPRCEFSRTADTLVLHFRWVETRHRKLCCKVVHLGPNSSAIFSKSFSTRVRVVMAGAPIRTPPGVTADRSPGTQFLFSVMLTASHIFSNLDPVTLLGFRSQRTR